MFAARGLIASLFVILKVDNLAFLWINTMLNPNRTNISANSKYGLGAAHFAVALSATLFLCFATGTIIICSTGYAVDAFGLCCNWTIGSAALTWFFAWLLPDEKAGKKAK